MRGITLTQVEAFRRQDPKPLDQIASFASTQWIMDAYIRPSLRISGCVSSRSSSLSSFDLGARYLNGFIDEE